MNAIVNRNLGV